MANFTELDRYLFGQATHYDIYRKLGAHFAEVKGVKGVYFDLWAPNAERVFLIGSFNGWNETANEMTRLKPETMGIYELFIPGLKEGELYKYLIETKDGKRLYKADPYANYAELRPGTASAIADIEHFKWTDSKWMENRKKEEDVYAQPMAIYEVHPGSWKRHPGRDDEGFYSYRDLVTYLIPYVKEMGYTHIELMGISEYPFDGSWGYQITGYFAPTSRYGEPKDFMRFIEKAHKAGIGVIVDWVPGHFCRDSHGLGRFNGDKLYEEKEHLQWGTYTFNFGKGEVRSFLISNVMYWIEKYHVDGIRVDGVSSILYMNFGIEDEKDKKYNSDGTEGDLKAIDFLQKMNSYVGSIYSDVMLIAEESTAWPLVTRPPECGGLGFHYKWDMGWMNDTLNYFKTDFPYKSYNHNLITFSMMYAYNENFILPLSHDEVVHGKGSMINKMYGAYDEKFASLRTLYGFTMAHPGKKLLFMGGEFAQFVEWRDKEQLDWFLIDQYEMHDSFHKYVAKLNEIYKSEPALYELDQDPAGFEWCLQRDADHSVVAFIRKNKKGRGRKQQQILCVCNFTPMEWDKYKVPLPKKSKLTKILDSSELDFGGDGDVSESKVSTKRVKVPSEGKKAVYQQAAEISLKPLSVVYYKIEEVETKPRKSAAKKAAQEKKTEAVKKTVEKKPEVTKKVTKEEAPETKKDTPQKEDIKVTKQTTETAKKKNKQDKKNKKE